VKVEKSKIKDFGGRCWGGGAQIFKKNRKLGGADTGVKRKHASTESPPPHGGAAWEFPPWERLSFRNHKGGWEEKTQIQRRRISQENNPSSSHFKKEEWVETPAGRGEKNLEMDRSKTRYPSPNIKGCGGVGKPFTNKGKEKVREKKNT